MKTTSHKTNPKITITRCDFNTSLFDVEIDGKNYLKPIGAICQLRQDGLRPSSGVKGICNVHNVRVNLSSDKYRQVSDLKQGEKLVFQN